MVSSSPGVYLSRCLSLPRAAFPEHGAAASPRAAAAGQGRSCPLTDAAIKGEAIVVEKFLPRVDRPARVNEHAPVAVFDGLAIWIAAMIDPPGGIAAYAPVDHSAVAELEHEGVVMVRRIAGRALASDARCRPGAAVFDNSRALAYGSRRKCAPAVDRGTANRIRRFRFRSAHRQSQERVVLCELEGTRLIPTSNLNCPLAQAIA
jgi:hypothetical protein